MSEENKKPEISPENRAEESPAQADYDKGRELRGVGDDSQAASFFHNALVGFEQSGDLKGVANASDQLGDICVARQEHDMALRHYRRAYDICAEEKDMFSIIALHKKMVFSEKALKQYDEAVKHYLNVIDIYAGYNNPAGTVAAMEELADLYLEMGERRKSAETYRTIASIHNNFRHARHAREFLDKAAQIEQGP